MTDFIDDCYVSMVRRDQSSDKLMQNQRYENTQLLVLFFPFGILWCLAVLHDLQQCEMKHAKINRRAIS